MAREREKKEAMNMGAKTSWSKKRRLRVGTRPEPTIRLLRKPYLYRGERGERKRGIEREINRY